jgi:hypothetical protein
MIDLSLGGLIGAMLGTVVAAVLYHLFIGRLEQAMQARRTSHAAEERDGGDIGLSIVRRAVLTIDLFAFAALGYWLGRMLDE